MDNFPLLVNFPIILWNHVKTAKHSSAAYFGVVDHNHMSERFFAAGTAARSDVEEHARVSWREDFWVLKMWECIRDAVEQGEIKDSVVWPLTISSVMIPLQKKKQQKTRTRQTNLFLTCKTRKKNKQIFGLNGIRKAVI